MLTASDTMVGWTGVFALYTRLTPSHQVAVGKLYAVSANCSIF